MNIIGVPTKQSIIYDYLDHVTHENNCNRVVTVYINHDSMHGGKRTVGTMYVSVHVHGYFHSPSKTFFTLAHVTHACTQLKRPTCRLGARLHYCCPHIRNNMVWEDKMKWFPKPWFKHTEAILLPLLSE